MPPLGSVRRRKEYSDRFEDDGSGGTLSHLPIVMVTPFEAAPPRSTLRYTLVLGTLVALGALGIDTYLPAFPAIAKSLGVTEGRVQLSLVSYFIAVALGQVVYGPLADRFGRRMPMLAGLGLFTMASVGCALTNSIEALIVLRFFQGLGACATMVIPRAVVRDLRSGEEAAKLFALMMLVLGVSPIFAPLLGSFIITWLPWQAMFWFLALYGALCMASVSLLLEESHPEERRTSGGVLSAFGTYARLLRDRSFLVPVMNGGFSQAVLFAYLTASPFVYIQLYHVDPKVYSLLFAFNAVGLIGLAQFNVVLLRRFGATRLLRFASAVQTVSALVLLLSFVLRVDSLPLTGLCLFLCVGVQGMVGPTTMMMALEPNPEVAGAASALSGTLQFACGAISGSLVSALFNGTAVPFALVVTVCAAVALGLAWLRPSPRLVEA
ncbi:Bcr/CflA family multidrug efflux MFS transporter [bacterium]|nr:MAG: Bcr/CflA family multidrug efflux MFS transporter [bacterium]